jgi:hypothetical protein
MSQRYFESLRPVDCSTIDAVPGGLFLTRVEHAQYRWNAQKPFYAVVFSVLEPKLLKGYRLSGRLCTTAKALWKLNWFLRDFGYDTELLSRGEINDRALVGLEGVVKVSYAIVKGMFYLNFEAFAPAEKWQELSPVAAADEHSGSEVA